MMKFQYKPLSAALALALSTTMCNTVSAAVPQEAVDACSGLSAGDSCSIATPDNSTISGFCATIENQLACDPNATGGSGGTGSTVPDDVGVIIGSTGGSLPDTGQSYCYDTAGSAVSCPASGNSTYGQDAQYQGNAMSYMDNGDGTVTDNVTNIMWQQSTDRDGSGTIDSSDKLSYTEALSYCENLSLAGHSDWQLPDITQLYSLIHFDGEDTSNYTGTDTTGLVPFIDTNYFDYGYGDSSAGERIIDSQYASSTLYVSTTMNGAETMFGVNFADGRIKGYPTSNKTYYVQCARNTGTYGQNNFTDNSDGTVTDVWTGLMWAQDDSAAALDWEQTLAWVERQNAANYLGYSDWRLPNIKELQSLIDYSRAPETHNSPAIDPVFNATAITNEGGETDYAFYWSGTTHLTSGDVNPGTNAAYMSFGRAIGSMDEGSTWLDVHGAGAQRSDPKVPETGVSYPNSHGPQGDTQRVYNYARLVRSADTTTDPGTTDPGTTDPGTTDPGTTDPGTTDPGTTDPGTTDPGTTDPGTTDPGTTDPGTTDPGTTTGDSQCSVYDPSATPQVSIPCVTVFGTTYSAGMNLVPAPGLRFAVDMNSLQASGASAGADCAVFPYNGPNRLRLNCVDLGGGTKVWAELDLLPSATAVEFDLADYGNY